VKKPDSLKRLLLRAVPQLAAAPESLLLFVDQGSVAARAGATLSFEYRYKLNLVATNFTGDRNAIIVPLLAWISEAQPDLLEKPGSEPFTFESEILDGDTADLSITLDLTEGVRVTIEDGAYQVRHMDEPPEPDRFPGVCNNLLQLFAGGELVAESDPVE